jgi:MFS family permease
MTGVLRKEGNFLILTKFLRVFAYGFISVILPVYLTLSGYSDVFIGIVIMLTIFANVFFNLIVTYYAGRVGEKRLLISLSLIMAVSGLLFMWNPNIGIFDARADIFGLSLEIGKFSPVIIIAALLGAISVTGTETGSFQSMESAMLACETPDCRRTLKFSTYNFWGYVALSFGSLFSGLPTFLSGASGTLDLRYMFLFYSIIAVCIAAVYLAMPEIRTVQKGDKKLTVSPETRGTVVRLSALFSLDAFGGGFVLKTILSLWFFKNWGMSLATLAPLFFVSDIITAISIFLAERVARRFGLLRTMVFTHLPSNIFLILIPFAPSVWLAVALLFARQSISQMDVPTRQSYVMAIVKPEDRTAVAALTNIPRTCAQGISPVMASVLIAGAMPFVLGGGMKIAYDVSIYYTFKDIKPPEELEIERRRKLEKARRESKKGKIRRAETEDENADSAKGTVEKGKRK